MTAISDCFKSLRDRGECALIPFITAGDPDLETTTAALRALDKAGADIIELGVPYSDPLADGPVIQAAATRALQRGTKLEQVLDIVRSLKSEIKAPIVLFIYYNPILNRGIEPFIQQLASAGVAGLVVPDLPLEEAESLLKPCAEYGVDLVLLVAPTSSLERLKAIAKSSQGFIYLVSVTGVTGMRSGLETRVEDLLQQLRQVTDKPIGIGFGISEAQHAAQVRKWGADAVIVGSAVVKRLADNAPEAGIKEVAEFCQSLKSAIK